ncbi:unnamed protein product [Brassica rapa]|uniref:Uncharacterized protein n=2 Tax=Brassica TaxID=3705 RepID=A0A8D9LT00_BRACM|nr:unnamed protein product [Brassica napus]CAG7885727.1 unnamed protein product [Brassica rapa]
MRKTILLSKRTSAPSQDATIRPHGLRRTPTKKGTYYQKPFNERKVATFDLTYILNKPQMLVDS